MAEIARRAKDATPRLELVPCPLCHGEQRDHVCRVATWKAPFDVVRCRDCTLLHINPRPSVDDLDALYDAGYYEGASDWHYADEREQQEQVRVRAAGRLARVATRLHAGGIETRRVVEIGSAFGVFLDEARKQGWESLGCEVSPASAEYAESTFGLTIRRVDLADADLPDASADLVTGSEVVEHLAAPMRTFRAAHRVLAPGGIVLFSTANERSAARLVRGARWGYYMPGHVVLWSATSLRDALQRAGFIEISVSAGDERGLANFLAFRRAAGAVTGTSLAAWMLRRLRLGDWTLGAGMIVSARKPLVADSSTSRRHETHGNASDGDGA